MKSSTTRYMFILALLVILWALAMAITSAFYVWDSKKAAPVMDETIFVVFNYITAGVTAAVSVLLFFKAVRADSYSA